MVANGKYSLISLPFAHVSGGNSKLTEAMSGEKWHGGENYNLGDQIQVWSAAEAKYIIYYYYVDDSHEWDGWYNMSDVLFDDCEENADGLEAGWNAWYLSRGTESPVVTMSGAVAPEDDVQFMIYGGGYTLLANPFPINTKPNDSTIVNWGNVHGGENYNLGDQIQLWIASDAKYEIYYNYVDDSHEWDGWYNMSDVWFEEVPGNENGIKAGDAFWYLSRDAKGTNHKITFWNPTK